MAAAHGAGQDPVAVHVGSDNVCSHELIQIHKDLSGQQLGQSRVRIGKTKSMDSEKYGSKYGRGMENGRRTVRSFSKFAAIHERMTRSGDYDSATVATASPNSSAAVTKPNSSGESS